MSWCQIVTGPWMMWVAKALLLVEMTLLSRSWAKQLTSVYNSGPLGEIALAIALGIAGFFCLNGILEGFDRGNMLGLVSGCLGIYMIAKAFLVLFAPHYLGFFPF